MSMIMRNAHQSLSNNHMEPSNDNNQENMKTIQNKIKNSTKCSCCPYGYHMDLDFVRYCEAFANFQISDSQKIRRNRRRQRKSMEVMLGIDHYLEVEYQNFNKSIAAAKLREEVPNENDEDLIISTPRRTSSKRWLENHNLHHNQLALHVNDVNGVTVGTQSHQELESSEFVSDALNDVCNVFERTLKRSNKKTRNHYIDDYRFEDETVFNVCPQQIESDNEEECLNEETHVSSIQVEMKSEVTGEQQTYNLKNITNVINVSDNDKGILKRCRSPTYSIKCASDVNTEALQTIREQMAISLLRTKELEEQIKMIPMLQLKIQAVQNEKLELVSRLKQAEDKLQQNLKLTSPTIQHINPISPKTLINKISPRRDVGTVISPQTRDIGCQIDQLQSVLLSLPSKNHQQLSTTIIKRTVGTNTDINLAEDCLLSQTGITILVDNKIKRQHSEIISKDFGSQHSPKKVIVCDASTQTSLIKHTSIGITVKPNSIDTAIDCQSIQHNDCATSTEDDVQITSNTVKLYRSIGMITELPIADPVSLQHLCHPSKSHTYKMTIGTQYDLFVGKMSKGIQSSKSGQLVNKSTQYTSFGVAKASDTQDLIKLISTSTNTNTISTKDSNTNTIPVPRRDFGTNSTLKPIFHDKNVNTTPMGISDVSCGTDDLPENIPAADGLSPPVFSKIPRATVLMSPRSNRKFARQNTYTIVDKVKEVNDENDRDDKNEDVDELSCNTVDENVCPAEVILRLSALETSSPSSVIATKTTITTKTTIEPNHKLENQLITTTTNEDRQPRANHSEEISQVSIGDEIATPSRITSPLVTPSLSVFHDYRHHAERSNDLLYNQLGESNQIREKVHPNREMMAALKVINDSIQKATHSSLKTKHLTKANQIVQKEWFNKSSTDSADPHTVEDYLDCFEEFSNSLLRYMVNLKDSNGNTCMHYSVSHGNFDVVSILLDAKVCDVNQTNNAGYTCVMLVSLAKLKVPAHRTVVQRLFQLSDVNLRAKKHNQTALMLAVSHGNLDMVQMLLEAGADINIQDEDGSTALMCAAEHGRIDIIKLLLAQSDCDSTIQDMDNSTALKISLEAGYRDIGVLLYAHEHMSRNKSPYTSLRRKHSKHPTPGSCRSPAVSPSSPGASSLKFNYSEHRKQFD